ncbi:globin-like protein [Mycena galericulata]|nr:globin-like protein [Mycena galericulata]
MTLTPSQIATVKATAPVLQQHGEAIATLFYRELLEGHPSLRDMFSATDQTTGRQPRALAGAVLAYATYIDDLPRLTAAVERIAHKHASLQVTPPQYEVVGQFLLAAIGQVLGPEGATAEVVDAWTAAYAALAAVFVAREAEMYKVQKADGWSTGSSDATTGGWRRFRILRKVPESSLVTSFYLAPVTAATPLPGYLPGQYVSVRVPVPQIGRLQCRQFSLSEAPRDEGDYYRISVKREENHADAVGGLVSNLLHAKYGSGDELELSHPQGEFFVDPLDGNTAGVPAVLISAGVGITPLLAILESLVPGKDRAPVQRPVSWIHAARSSAERPFAEVVGKICRENDNVSVRTFLRHAGADDSEYDFGGTRLDLGRLDGERDLHLGNKRAEYYVCGPEGFMGEVRRGLGGLGVARERVHLELFGVGTVDE